MFSPPFVLAWYLVIGCQVLCALASLISLYFQSVFCSICSSFIVVYFSRRYEKLLNEMLNHLERQPRNKDRRIVWLTHINPLFNGVGLVLLAHFRRIFPLFFKWIHADDDETVLLVRVISVWGQIVIMHFTSVNVFWKFSMPILRL